MGRALDDAMQFLLNSNASATTAPMPTLLCQFSHPNSPQLPHPHSLIPTPSSQLPRPNSLIPNLSSQLPFRLRRETSSPLACADSTSSSRARAESRRRRVTREIPWPHSSPRQRCQQWGGALLEVGGATPDAGGTSVCLKRTDGYARTREVGIMAPDAMTCRTPMLAALATFGSGGRRCVT